MGRALQVVLTALAVLLASSVTSDSPAVTAGAGSGTIGAASAVRALGGDNQPLERQIRDIARSVLREVRWAMRTVVWMLWRGLDLWGTWLKRAGFSVAVSVVAALADSGLVNAWRGEGLRALARYSTLMLYVYTRLWFSGRVNLGAKLLLVGALIYGVVRHDLVPDSSLVPGRVEDVVL